MKKVLAGIIILGIAILSVVLFLGAGNSDDAVPWDLCYP
jgi:hypothetical protein